MRTSRLCLGIVLVAACCLPPAAVFGSPLTFSQLNVPDFSQHEVVGWSNYCAPTAGTNVAYFFGQTYNPLYQGHPVPPAPTGQGTAADMGASTNIGGNVPPPAPLPPPDNMANLMATTAAGGTTLFGMRNGLDQYLERNDGNPGNAFWTTYMLQPSVVGGQPFWSTLQGELSGGAGVLLAIGWQQGAPGGYDTPDDYFYSDYPEAPMGHAVTMVGYDVSTADPANHTLSIHDPANNPPGVGLTTTHVWPPVLADTYPVSVNQFDLSINVAGQRATIYGAVITNPIPEPGTIVMLLGAGLMGLLAYARRRRKQ